MPYLLDTYNILPVGISMGGAVSDLTVRKLCQWIVASPQRLNATLVLDGRAKPDEPSPNEFPEVTLLYSGTGISADTVIAQRVELSGNKRKLTVVTNDRAVALHARKNFANAMSCEAFLSMLIGGTASSNAADRARLPAKKTRGSPSPGETEHWLKEFGITPPPPKPPSQNPSDSPLNEFGDIDMDKLMGN
jgi:hypothetical protein